MRVETTFYEAGEAVPETEAISLAVKAGVDDHIADHLDEQRRLIQYGLRIGGIGVGLGMVLLTLMSMPVLGIALALIGLAVGGALVYVGRTREPDVSVEGVRKGYWTGYLVQDGDDVVVYDAVGSVSDTAFDLERLSDRDRIAAATDRLGEITDLPVVMPESGNVEQRLLSTLDDVYDEIDDAERRTVEAPIIRNDDHAVEGIRTLAPRADAPTVAVDTAIDREKATSDVDELAELEDLAASDEGEAELEVFSETSRKVVTDLTETQETAIGLVNDHIQTAADVFGMVSYRFYCPKCKDDDVESPVEFVDSEAPQLYCDTCQTHHAPEATVPRHRIKDEIVNPVWDQLWREKDDERRRIYEEIEDQKADLQEREFEQRREEIRSTTDRIQDLRAKIRDLKTEAKAARGTVDEIGDLMVKYDRLNEQRKEEFRTEVEDKFARIDEKTRQILEETRNEEQERIQAAEQEASDRAKRIRLEERKRQQAQFLAEQRLENQRKAAELQQQKDFHRDELLLETRGKLSISDTINNAHYWKARHLGATTNGGGD